MRTLRTSNPRSGGAPSAVCALLSTLLLTVCTPSPPAHAQLDCTLVLVPYTWTLTRTGDPLASVFVDNTGGIGTSLSDTDTMAGNFIIQLLHTPPANICEQLDPLPTQVTLNVTATWTGVLSNSTIALDPFGVTIDTFCRSTATVSAPPGFPAFTPATEEIGSATSKDINQAKNLAFLTGPGTVPYSGSVDMQTLFGFGSGTLGDFVTGAASLEVNGALLAPTSGTIRYRVLAAPEPGTGILIAPLLAVALLGAGVLKRRRRGP